MEGRHRFLRIILTVSVSVLFSILVVFAVVQAQSYLRGPQSDPLAPALKVEGRAETEGGVYFNSAGSTDSTGLLVLGKVGIGLGFNEVPQADLDVDGWVRASGARFDTVMVDGRWPTFVVEKYSGLAQSNGNNDPVRACSSKVTADLCIVSYCDIRHLNNDIAKCDLNYNAGLKQWEICAIAAADDDKTIAYAAMMCFDF